MHEASVYDHDKFADKEFILVNYSASIARRTSIAARTGKLCRRDSESDGKD